MDTWWCESAWIEGTVVNGVAITADPSGSILGVEVNAPPDVGERLSGLVFPGFANAHSHAFHRALRGRTHQQGDFWAWRDAMYQIAHRLDPDSYRELATAVYTEMVLAGFTCVGEFHYLHHQPDGRPYDEPNAMGLALIDAARQAGIRLTLLDACYLTGGIGQPLGPLQVRFGDGDADHWAIRMAELSEDTATRVGAAVHSVRAVPVNQVSTVAEAAAGRPLHVHLSEQPAENEDCLRAYGLTPANVLAEQGALGPNTTVIHATHVSADDLELLGTSGSGACICPTTERDLGDGIGPAWELAEAGVQLSLGSDQHAVIDPFEEARGLELHERLDTGARGAFSSSALINALTVNGHRALGWNQGGVIQLGAPCDLVAVNTSSVRTAGADPGQLVYAATASDVSDVVINGQRIVGGGEHRFGDPGPGLARAITELWD
ncbi:MAG TPA: formimidoylglutamate deiminase [Acidimicrobiia bacterium]|nr:formimidoylglutamate deiminase [Acidimicrobiia bacterium]